MFDLNRDGAGLSRRTFGLALGSAAWSCTRPAWGAGEGRVVVYTALDREFSEPILQAYERKSGDRVAAKFDVESTKTVGLTQLLIAEAKNPRCDLFWNNEILNTLRLKRAGLLQAFRPAHAADYPAEFRDPEETWYGFAARARVLLVNDRLVAPGERPARINDLTEPLWRGRVGLAKPLFGTTATHATCLFAAWGPEKAKAFFRALKGNGLKVYSGNKGVAQAVGSGELAVGLTDTDDARGEIEAGRPVTLVYPDREAGGLGTLFIPNTLALMRGTRGAAAATALAGHLLSPEVESALAEGPSAQVPLNPQVKVKPKVETPATVPAMKVDWDRAVSAWDEAAAFLAAEFAG